MQMQEKKGYENWPDSSLFHLCTNDQAPEQSIQVLWVMIGPAGRARSGGSGSGTGCGGRRRGKKNVFVHRSASVPNVTG